MKKILLFLSLFAMVFTSCETEDVDEIFDQSPEQRVSEQLNAVRTDLMSNEMGWLSTYTCQEGAKELVLVIKFIDETRAEISAPEYDMKQESGYVLNYTQQVDLVFDTHSFLALLVDIEWKADFRWELDKLEDGQYFFKSVAGKSEGQSVMNMVKASPEKLQSALNVQALKTKMKANPAKSFFRNLEIDGVASKYSYSYVGGKVIFSTLKEGELISFNSEVTINEEGFVLQTPFTVGDVNIEAFKYNEAEESFTVSKPEGIKASIVYGSKPFSYSNGTSLFFGNPKHYFNVKDYSDKLKTAIDDLKSKDPDFGFLQIYVNYPLSSGPLNDFAYYRGAAPTWMDFYMSYENNGVDEVTFKFAGASQSVIDYYRSSCSASFNMFWDKTFTIVPSEGGIILVQNDDPSIWMIAKN